MLKIAKSWAIMLVDIFLLFIPFTEIIDNAGKVISALCGAILTAYTVRKLRMDYKNRAQDEVNKKLEEQIKQAQLEQEHIKLAKMMERNKAAKSNQA